MKLHYAILCFTFIGKSAFGMLAAVEALAANPAAQQLAESLGATALNTFAHSSTFASLTTNSHSAQVISGLETLAPQVQAASAAIAGGGALPVMPANNANQAVLGQALTLAQTAQTALATNPSVKAKVLRILIGAGMTAVGAGDLITNYVYTQKAVQAGKQATSSVLGTPIDLSVMGAGLYQMYLGISNWDTVAKQNDAATATKLVQGHIAQLAQPAAAAAPAPGLAQV